MPAEQPGITVEEHYSYRVELGCYPWVEWIAEQSYGELRVCVPYDGVRLPRTVDDATLDIGELYAQTSDGKRGATLLPIQLPAGERWEMLLKSGQQALVGGRYAVAEPAEPLFSIQGAVSDRPLNWQELVRYDLRGFEGALQLFIDLWAPDLIEQSRPREADELDLLLLRRQHLRQIFFSQVRSNSDVDQLAEALAALANTQGGAILVGVDSAGNVEGLGASDASFDALVLVAARAVLQITPPPTIARMRRLRHSSGREVAVIETPASAQPEHNLNGRIYRRDGASTIAETATAAQQPRTPPVGPTLPLPRLELLLQPVERQPGRLALQPQSQPLQHPVILLDETAELGKYVCGLLNSRQGGLIVIVHPPGADQTSWQARLRSTFSGAAEREARFGRQLKSALAGLRPDVMPAATSLTLHGTPTTVVHVPSIAAWPSAPPFALFEGNPYLWREGELEQLPAAMLLDRLRSKQTVHEEGSRAGDQKVYLEAAALHRPIRPPEAIRPQEARLPGGDPHGDAYRPAFDIQHQTMQWGLVQFEPDPVTLGHALRLSAPLQFASLQIDAHGRVAVGAPNVAGRLSIRLNDALASGLKVGVSAKTQELAWLEELPLTKRTFVHLDIQVQIAELYERRNSASFLSCVLPNVALDEFRLRDIEKVCEDLGFRMARREPAGPRTALLYGLRSAEFHDLSLTVALLQTEQEADREVRHTHHTDRRRLELPTLEIRVGLAGAENAADSPLADEIKRLQIALFRTLRDRLRYLGIE